MDIRIGIVGYGNVGKGVEEAIAHHRDTVLTGIYTRRDPKELKAVSAAKVYSLSQLEKGQEDVDVLILCGGSATDLPAQSPALAGMYNIVDSFDTHARIPEHFKKVDEAAKAGGTTALISAGWDPGLFSMTRVLGESLLPDGRFETFWGPGISQGHSDALRRIAGVKDARQYTVPVSATLQAVKKGSFGELSARDKHTRECFVVLEEGADPVQVTEAIVTMPNYFDAYNTSVTFVSQEELLRDHAAMPHAGQVLRFGHTDANNSAYLGLEVKMDSNPQFTGSLLVAFARGVYRFHREGRTGCFTALDMPLQALCPLSREELLKSYL